MNDALVFQPNLFEIGPKQLLRVDGVAREVTQKVAVLSRNGFAEIVFHHGGAMREAGLQIGHAAKKLHLVSGQIPFPLLPPFLPVVADVLELFNFTVQRMDDAGALIELPGQSGHGHVHFAERFELRFHASHQLTVERDLIAHEPGKRSRHALLDGLNDFVE